MRWPCIPIRLLVHEKIRPSDNFESYFAIGPAGMPFGAGEWGTGAWGILIVRPVEAVTKSWINNHVLLIETPTHRDLRTTAKQLFHPPKEQKSTCWYPSYPNKTEYHKIESCIQVETQRPTGQILKSATLRFCVPGMSIADQLKSTFKDEKNYRRR